MDALLVRDYWNNLAALFARADKGEKVLIRRKNQIYTLASVGREDLMITPELQVRIAEAEKNCRDGHCVVCSNPEELDRYLDSL